MAQKRPTPPGKGGAGNVTCLAACELPDHSVNALRVQFLRSHFDLPAQRADLVAGFGWGGAHA